MYLIKDHLLSKGLTQTAELLEKELLEKELGGLVESGHSAIPLVRVNSFSASQSSAISSLPASQPIEPSQDSSKGPAATAVAALLRTPNPHHPPSSRKRAMDDGNNNNGHHQHLIETVLNTPAASQPHQAPGSAEMIEATNNNGKRQKRTHSPFTLAMNPEAFPSMQPQVNSSNQLPQQQQPLQPFQRRVPIPRSTRAKAVQRALQEKSGLFSEIEEQLQQHQHQPAAVPLRLSSLPSSQSLNTSIAANDFTPFKVASPSIRGSSTAAPASSTVPSAPIALISSQPPKTAAKESATAAVSHRKSIANSQSSAITTSAATNTKASSSKLSGIMHRYLKLQHQQCKHPITTLPTLSLLKPHTCPKPAFLSNSHNPFAHHPARGYSNSTGTTNNNNPFNNNALLSSIFDRRLSMSNTHWYNMYYRRYDAFEKNRFIFSNYRNIKSFRELENPSSITASCFSKKMNKLYLTFNDYYSTNEDPGLAVVDILTGETIVSGHNELEGSITKLQLSPHLPLIMTDLSQQEYNFNYLETILEHEILIWKDTNDITIFDNSIPLKKYEIKNMNDIITNNQSLFHLSADQLYRANYFHDNLFDPFHANQFAALKIHDFFHQPYQGNHHHGENLSLNHHQQHTGAGGGGGGIGSRSNTLQSTNSTTPATDDHSLSSTYIFDIETGQILQTLYNDGTSDAYSLPKITYHPHHPHLLFFDGKLWDLRINQIIHKFDKLSHSGNMFVHPYKSELIIDSAIWDLRNYSLLTMIPLLDNSLLQFHGSENIFFANGSVLDDEQFISSYFNETNHHHHPLRNHQEHGNKYNSFHIFSSSDYSLLSTEYIEKENMNLFTLQLDPWNYAYLNVLLFNLHDVNDSMCRIYEIGRKKKSSYASARNNATSTGPGVGVDDSDDGEDDEDDDDDDLDSDDEDDGEWRNIDSSDDDDDDDEDDDEDIEDEETMSEEEADYEDYDDEDEEDDEDDDDEDGSYMDEDDDDEDDFNEHQDAGEGRGGEEGEAGDAQPSRELVMDDDDSDDSDYREGENEEEEDQENSNQDDEDEEDDDEVDEEEEEAERAELARRARRQSQSAQLRRSRLRGVGVGLGRPGAAVSGSRRPSLRTTSNNNNNSNNNNTNNSTNNGNNRSNSGGRLRNRPPSEE